MIFRFDTVECIRNTLFDDFLQLTSEAPTSRSEIDALLFNYGEPANSQPLGPHPAPNLIHFFLKEGWILSYRHAEHYYHIFGPWARQQVMVPATYRPLLCDSGQIGWRFFEILTPPNCPRKQPLS